MTVEELIKAYKDLKKKFNRRIEILKKIMETSNEKSASDRR